jgi:hypothetical protein
MTADNTKLAPQMIARSFLHRNIVVRDVRDRNGDRIGKIVEPHDGTEAGVIDAARRATERMYTEYPEASNIQSRIGATDGTGSPMWSISPNFLHIAQIGTDEARYIWGEIPPRVEA